MLKIFLQIVQAIFVITTHCLFSALSLSSSEEDDTFGGIKFSIEAIICILFMAVEFNQRCTQFLPIFVVVIITSKVSQMTQKSML